MLDIKTVCLGLLTFRDATGYELKRYLASGAAGRGLNASFGSIYPALNRLADEGLVAVKSSKSGRSRKTYSITPQGLKKFAQTLDRRPEHDRLRSEFLFYMSFVHLLTKEHVNMLIDLELQRLVSVKAELSAEERGWNRPSRDLIVGFGKSAADCMINYLTTHRADFLQLAGTGLSEGSTPLEQFHPSEKQA